MTSQKVEPIYDLFHRILNKLLYSSEHIRKKSQKEIKQKLILEFIKQGLKSREDFWQRKKVRNIVIRNFTDNTSGHFRIIRVI